MESLKKLQQLTISVGRNKSCPPFVAGLENHIDLFS